MDYKGIKCKSCCLTMPKSRFSNGQLKKKSDNRTCEICTEKNKIGSEKLLSNLTHWLVDNKADIGNVEIVQYSKEHRGVVSKKRIQPFSSVIEIPYKCILEFDKITQSPVCQPLLSHNLDKHSIIAIYLIQERNDPGSFWKPYLDILPTEFENVPMFYSKETMKELNGCFSMDMIKARILEFTVEYEKIKALVPFEFSLHEYVWGRTVVVTRIFGFRYNEKDTSGLVPLADMLNHSLTPGTKWEFVGEKNCFVITTQKWVLKNSPILDTYGGKCNSRYLVNYGFTLEDNEDNNQCALFFSHNNISLRHSILLGKPRSIESGFTRYSSLIDNYLETKVSRENMTRFQVPRLQDGDKDNQTCIHMLLTFVRVMVCEEKDLPDKIDILTDPFSKENEIRAFDLIKKSAIESLSGYPTTLEEDIKKISTLEKYTPLYNIINMRISEKNTLKYYIELADIVKKIDVNKLLRKNENKYIQNYYKKYWIKLV